MKQIVKTRNKLEPLRMEIQSRISEKFLDSLLQRLNLSEEQVFTFNCPINLSYLFNISSFLPPNVTTKLSYSAFSPVVHPIADKKHSVIDFIEKKDLLLFYPFESMKPFLNLIKEASEREDVQSIKITLYRISKDSKLAEYLINAVENGKDVTVLMELRARFDETNNIEWAQKLEEAGCHIIYGTDGFKVHSKICMITYRKDGEIKHITQVGTGNYNEKTSKMYTDYSFMTSDIEIGRDADIFFKNMALGNLMGVYKKLWVAPSSFKQNILKNIDNEIEKAKRGKEGKIVIKCNSFTDKDLILALAEASDLGVKITLIVRGICCLVPQTEGKTRNIKVVSVVGRFLEHSRIYSFGVGEEQVLYIASGDMMTRNTEHRVEVGCPIFDKDIKERINSHIETILEDNQKARVLEANGEYKIVSSSESERKINSQEEFIREAEKNVYQIITEEPKVVEEKKAVKEGFLKRLFHIS
jgi:polyphosphate kinase